LYCEERKKLSGRFILQGNAQAAKSRENDVLNPSPGSLNS